MSFSGRDCQKCYKLIRSQRALIHPGRWPAAYFHIRCAKQEYPTNPAKKAFPGDWEWTQFTLVKIPADYLRRLLKEEREAKAMESSTLVHS